MALVLGPDPTYARACVGSDDGTNSGSRQWQLLVEHLPMLRTHVRRLVNGDEAVGDVLQEVSLRILVCDGPAEDPARFAAWSRGVARHVAAYHARSYRRTSRHLPLEHALDETAVEAGADPERTFDARETLARAFRGLDADARELLVRRYLLGETGEELAGERAQSSASLRMRLMRLRASLRGWGRVVFWLLAAQGPELVSALAGLEAL
jgi:RNA polymerase sigma factor (sigma-70 family)